MELEGATKAIFPLPRHPCSPRSTGRPVTPEVAGSSAVAP